MLPWRPGLRKLPARWRATAAARSPRRFAVSVGDLLSGRSLRLLGAHRLESRLSLLDECLDLRAQRTTLGDGFGERRSALLQSDGSLLQFLGTPTEFIA